MIAFPTRDDDCKYIQALTIHAPCTRNSRPHDREVKAYRTASSTVPLPSLVRRPPFTCHAKTGIGRTAWRRPVRAVGDLPYLTPYLILDQSLAVDGMARRGTSWKHHSIIYLHLEVEIPIYLYTAEVEFPSADTTNHVHRTRPSQPSMPSSSLVASILPTLDNRIVDCSSSPESNHDHDHPEQRAPLRDRDLVSGTGDGGRRVLQLRGRAERSCRAC